MGRPSGRSFFGACVGRGQLFAGCAERANSLPDKAKIKLAATGCFSATNSAEATSNQIESDTGLIAGLAFRCHDAR